MGTGKLNRSDSTGPVNNLNLIRPRQSQSFLHVITPADDTAGDETL